MQRKSSTKITALMIGDFSSREFYSMRTNIPRFADVTLVRGCTEAVDLLRGEQAIFDLAIIAERWPGEHARGTLEQIQRESPIMRMIAICGSWCEGQKRSAPPWPGMLHTSWHRWLPHWQDDLVRLSNHRLPSFGLPVAASEHERTLFREFPARTEGKLVAIRNRREDMADMLASACRSQGYATAWLDPRHPLRLEGPDAILWEGSPHQLDDLQSTHFRYQRVPILALLDFPRIDDVERAITLGATEILAKPMHLDDLFTRIAALLGTHHQNKTATSPN